jgi:hypothetical protein
LNYYLDVDGTIITKEHQEALGLNDFLKYLFNSGEVFWLTTHCRYLDTSSVLSYLEQFLEPKNYALVKNIFPTTWNTMKTEAINFSHPFYWFDDYLLEAEIRILQKNMCFEKWIKIDLGKNDQDIMRAATLYYPNLFTSI